MTEDLEKLLTKIEKAVEKLPEIKMEKEDGEVDIHSRDVYIVGVGGVGANIFITLLEWMAENNRRDIRIHIIDDDVVDAKYLMRVPEYISYMHLGSPKVEQLKKLAIAWLWSGREDEKRYMSKLVREYVQKAPPLPEIEKAKNPIVVIAVDNLKARIEIEKYVRKTRPDAVVYQVGLDSEIIAINKTYLDDKNTEDNIDEERPSYTVEPTRQFYMLLALYFLQGYLVPKLGGRHINTIIDGTDGDCSIKILSY